MNLTTCSNQYPNLNSLLLQTPQYRVPGLDNAINNTNSVNFAHSESGSVVGFVGIVPSHKGPNSNDPFVTLLLPKLLDMIISLNILSSRDIASMRPVSQTFPPLSKSLFRQRVLTDIPWLFEARTIVVWEIVSGNLYRNESLAKRQNLQNRKRL